MACHPEPQRRIAWRLIAFSPEFESYLQSRTPEWASAITGLSVAEIEAFALQHGDGLTTARLQVEDPVGPHVGPGAYGAVVLQRP